MENEYMNGYRQAEVDIQEKVYKLIKESTNLDGKINADYFKKELEVEVFFAIPPFEELT